ncbi:MAG: hypothetical protein ABI113_01575, partial [Mucilaginibacter sp.]
DTLLKGLRDEDFDSLIKQEKFRSQGYTIHFVVDAGLIYNYCFPEAFEKSKTSLERRKKLAIPEYAANEQVTLHSIFFLNKGKERVVFFDQYIPELDGVIEQAVTYKAYTGTVLNSVEFTLTDPKELAFDSFSKIFANLLLHVNGLRKISNLLASKALIIEPKELENDFIAKTLVLNKGTQETTDKVKDLLSQMLNEELFESKKRDAVVFDRVISINNFIQKFGDLEERKHVFILLTDSSVMRRLGHRLTKIPEYINYPTIHSEYIELTRSVQQYFAYLISIVYKESGEVDHQKTIENLYLLKDYSREIQNRFFVTEQIIQKKNSDTIINLLTSEKYGKVFDNYKTIRDEFENSGLLRSFDGLYKSIKPTLKDKKFNLIRAFFEAIENDIEQLNKELGEKHRILLKRLLNEAIFNTTFINGIEQISKSGVNFILKKGEDLIEGSYQHLPIFLTFSKIKKLQLHTFNFLALILTKKTEESKGIVYELDEILNLLVEANSNGDWPIEVKLLKAFIFILLPSEDESLATSYKKSIEVIDNNAFALEWLEGIYQRTKIDDSELSADLLYLLCWTARRVKDYKKALSYANIGIKVFSDDPRFYHGKFLADYCIYQSAQRASGELIDEMLKNLKLSVNFYTSFISNHYIQFDSVVLLYDKLIDTFNNNFCYCLVLKASYLASSQTENDVNLIVALLTQARNHLKALKLENGAFKDELAEYYDTESHLEYIEADYLKGKHRVKKLHNAQLAISQAIKLSTHEGLKNKYGALQFLIDSKLKR